jgi:hypothetical protein
MNPESKESLDVFLKQFSKVGSYYLTAVIIGPGDEPMLYKHKIKKKLLVVKTPEEVGDNDPDSVLLGESKRE